MRVAGNTRDQPFAIRTGIEDDGRYQRCRLCECGLRVELQRAQFAQTLACRLASRTYLHRHEAHLVASFELADLPKIRFDDRRRTNETAKARSIGPENHGHVAGEIDGADRIRV